MTAAAAAAEEASAAATALKESLESARRRRKVLISALSERSTSFAIGGDLSEMAPLTMDQYAMDSLPPTEESTLRTWSLDAEPNLRFVSKVGIQDVFLADCRTDFDM
jgi:hypothetical protein